MQITSLKPISQIIVGSLPANFAFKPQKEFYDQIGINKHRFAKILKGSIDPTRTEIYALSIYFEISAEQFLN